MDKKIKLFDYPMFRAALDEVKRPDGSYDVDEETKAKGFDNFIDKDGFVVILDDCNG